MLAMYYIAIVLLYFTQNAENRRMVGGRTDDDKEYPYVVRIGHRVMQRIVDSRRIETENSTEILCNETTKTISEDCIMFRREGLYDQEWRVTRTCTGAVLNPKWTLTAGHCLPAILDSKNGAVIQYGQFSDNSMTKSIAAVDKVHYHPNTKLVDLNGFLQLYNDIGLMSHGIINLKLYGKLSAVESNSLFGQKSLLAGLGNLPGSQETEELQLLEVVTRKCEDENLKIRVFPAICVARKCDSVGGICEGDSGGPLIHASGIVGIGSLGLVNCETKKTGFSGTVTSISPYLKWIRGITKEKEKNS